MSYKDIQLKQTIVSREKLIDFLDYLFDESGELDHTDWNEQWVKFEEFQSKEDEKI